MYNTRWCTLPPPPYPPLPHPPHTQAGDASGTGLLDLTGPAQWSSQMCDLVDPSVRGWLPALVQQDEVGAPG